MNAIKKISMLIEQASSIAKDELNIDNIFYNESYIDLLIADKLNHKYNIETQGPDGYGPDGEWVEYKSINLNSKNKGSFQFHWISKEKLEKYKKSHFYFVIRRGSVIKKIYFLENKIIFPLLKKQFLKCNKKILSDKKNIKCHKSFSEKKIIELGAIIVYERNNIR